MSVSRINPGATLLDTVAAYPATIPVFRSWDERAGECLLCKALFLSIGEAAHTYGLDLETLLAELEAAAENGSATGRA
ncbi:MAG: hypothetical protein V3573_04500 [Desulfovibrionaceae bacterium]